MLDDKPDKYLDNDHADAIGPGVGWASVGVGLLAILAGSFAVNGDATVVKHSLLTALPVAGVGAFLGLAAREHRGGRIGLAINGLVLLFAAVLLLVLQVRMWSAG